MGISPQIAQDLRNVVEMIKKIDADYKKCEPDYRKVEADLQEAIDDESIDELELFRPQMDSALKGVDKCMHAINGALALLGNLRKDADLMAEKTEQINSLVKALVNKKQVLAAHAEKGRAMLLDDSQEALDAAKTGSLETEGNLSDLKNAHLQMQKAIDHIEAEGKKLDAATLAAQAKGNARLMSAARVKFLELGYTDLEISAQGLLARVKKAHPQFKDNKQRAEAQWILDDLPGLIGRCRKMSARGQELALLKIATAPAAPASPPAKLTSSQVATLAKHFPLDGDDSKELSKFGKILNENPHNEWPPRLIRVFGWSKSEVDAGMKRANHYPFVKALYLIDI